ncbi:hypothetical protein ACFF45_33845, partial [Streptomyces cinereospinus]
RPLLRIAHGGLAVAAAAAVLAGLGWLATRSGAGTDTASGAGADSAAVDSAHTPAGPLGRPAYLACTRLLAEGEVTRVVPVPGTDRERVTLDVARSYVPAGADPAQVTFVKDDDAVLGAPRHLHVGDYVLVAVARRADTADFWFVGEEAVAEQRRAIAGALPRARTGTCP